MNELGLDLDNSQCIMISNLVTTFDLTFSDVTYSSGRSLIFYKNDKVYQLYLSHNLFTQVIHNLKLLHPINGIIIHYDIHSTFNTIEYERIKPIYNVVDNSICINHNFFIDVYSILESLLEHRIVHGDFCCDNIGYSFKQAKYVLYDFETVRCMQSGEEDVDRVRFEKSIKFCKSH